MDSFPPLIKGGEGGFVEGTFQRLRKGMTDAEKTLWLRIRGKQLKGYQFYRQKPIGNFRLFELLSG